jgi:hypothetical protein
MVERYWFRPKSFGYGGASNLGRLGRLAWVYGSLPKSADGLSAGSFKATCLIVFTVTLIATIGYLEAKPKEMFEAYPAP